MQPRKWVDEDEEIFNGVELNTDGTASAQDTVRFRRVLRGKRAWYVKRVST